MGSSWSLAGNVCFTIGERYEDVAIPHQRTDNAVQPAPVLPTEIVLAAPQAAGVPRKKRGRPPGSKNKCPRKAPGVKAAEKRLAQERGEGPPKRGRPKGKLDSKPRAKPGQGPKYVYQKSYRMNKKADRGIGQDRDTGHNDGSPGLNPDSTSPLAHEDGPSAPSNTDGLSFPSNEDGPPVLSFEEMLNIYNPSSDPESFDLVSIFPPAPQFVDPRLF